MPRKRLEHDDLIPANLAIAEKLAKELKHSKDSGQPLVYEKELAPKRLRVVVIWDAWDAVPLEERTAAILRAYELAEGVAYRNKIGLASGLTVPEATASGMLPYQVGTALRKSDPVTFEECSQAMLAEGASKLFGPNVLQLRFATSEEADECRRRLIQRLPKSENVWIVSREVAVQDFSSLADTMEVSKA